MTVGEFFDRWADLYPRPDEKTTVHNGYMVRPFVVEHERRELREVDRPIALEWAVGHPGQVRYLRAFFNDAIDFDACRENPFRGLQASRPAAPVAIPTEDDLAFIAVGALEAGGLEFGNLVLAAAWTGLRFSELTALEVNDVMLEPTLRIRVREGKGRRSRTVTAFSQARDALRVQKLARVSGIGPFVLGPDALLFENEGKPWSRWSAGRRWAKACERAGVGFTWHALRHFCATWLLDQGASVEDVAWQLHGTFDPREVIRTYGHPSGDLALERLSEVTRAAA